MKHSFPLMGIIKTEVICKKMTMNKKELDARVQRAVDNFMEGYGCCQSVVAAFADLYGVSDEPGSHRCRQCGHCCRFCRRPVGQPDDDTAFKGNGRQEDRRQSPGSHSWKNAAEDRRRQDHLLREGNGCPRRAQSDLPRHR